MKTGSLTPSSSQEVQTWGVPEERQQAWQWFLESRNLRIRGKTPVQPQQLKAMWAAALVSFSFQSTATLTLASQERRWFVHQHQFEIYTNQGNHCCTLETYKMVKTSTVYPSLCARCRCFQVFGCWKEEMRKDKFSVTQQEQQLWSIKVSRGL